MRSPQETFNAMRDEVTKGLHASFPVQTGLRTLELTNVHIDEMPGHDDWNGQKDAVLSGRTWGVPIKAAMHLKDKDGKTVDKRLISLGMLPAPTNRHTFIIDGREYQVSNQRRLKPGFFSKINRLGEAIGDIHTERGRNMSISLDPQDSQVYLKFANTHIPVNTVLKHVFDQPKLGIGPAFEKNFSQDEEDQHLRALYSSVIPGPVPQQTSEVKSKLKDYFQNARLDPSIMKMNLGHAHELVDGKMLQDAAGHVLKVHRRELMPTDKDQMAFQQIYGVEDFIGERLTKNKRMIQGLVKRRVDRVKSLTDLHPAGIIAPMVQGFFTESSLSNTTSQINPLEMAENAFKITSMGEGGISDTVAVPNEVRAIHPSHHGFIDPVRTPDNAKAGVDVRTTLFTKKVGRDLLSPVIDAKTQREVMKSPMDLFDRVVAHDKEPQKFGFIRAIHKGQLVEVKPGEIDYYIPTEKMWTPSTAIVPFVSNSHAHRVAMGAKMLGQSLSLIDRERPLVDTMHSGTALRGLNPFSPVDGTISKIEPGVIHVRGVDGSQHAINYAHEFPLNGGSFLHTDLKVKAGDRVSKGQLLGDHNFSKDGEIALGRNMMVAYVPFKGSNYEDGITITESAAKKLVSQHQYLHEVDKDIRNVHSKAKFVSHFPGIFESHHLNVLDDDGVVKVGTKLTEGMPILAMLRERVVNPEQLILGKAHKSLMEPYKNTSVLWDQPHEGTVTAVKKTNRGIKVTITSNAPATIGDKLTGRFGNKGVITEIIPDSEAPRTADGRIPDVLLNSAGLNSRMNNGQIYEVVAGKALQKMGIKNKKFEQFLGANTHEAVKDLVKKSGIQESEEMFDGKTGLPIGKIMMGPQYMLKLFKTADSGFSARSGGDYDIDMRPAKGGDDGAKSVGTLDLAALLASGAKNILRESGTMKAEYSPEMYEAMWTGRPLPPPKPTFAFNKFLAMMQGMGINVTKNGSKFALIPMTDKDVLARSNGQVIHALTVNDKRDERTGLPFRPEEGGLFDNNITGGLVGQRWAHIKLSEPVVNPMFHGPVRVLLGMTKDQLSEEISKVGGAGIAQKLSGIDPARKISELQEQLKSVSSAQKKDSIYKQLRYLNTLRGQNLKPHEAYVTQHIPVVPPAFRPIYPDAQTGAVVTSDANRLYQNLMLTSQQLSESAKNGDAGMVKSLRSALHKEVARVQGVDPTTERDEKDPKGFLKIITGANAKEGFFQSKLMGRRQDVAGRGVVVPDANLGLDEIAIPEPMAWKLFRNHITGELVKSGMPLPKAALAVKEQDERARSAMRVVMDKTPLLMSRAPSLHKFSIQAFKTQLTDGKSIRVNNLIHKGFNMDHDGDAVNVHIPMGHEAIQEAHGLVPSKNLFNPLNSNPINTPTNETILGLWKITNKTSSDKPVKRFDSHADAIKAFESGQVRIDDPIEVNE